MLFSLEAVKLRLYSNRENDLLRTRKVDILVPLREVIIPLSRCIHSIRLTLQGKNSQ